MTLAGTLEARTFQKFLAQRLLVASVNAPDLAL
jgi:hypothetical protein